MTGIEVRRFDPHTASEAELRAVHAMALHMKGEGRPDEPLPPFAVYVTELRTRWPDYEMLRWVVWQGDLAVADAEFGLSRRTENPNFAQFWVFVLPGLRRRGIGRSLLREVASVARAEGRTLLSTVSSSNGPDGGTFLDHLGASLANEWISSDLAVADVDQGVLKEWLSRGEGLSDRFELVTREGPHPDDEMAAICEMYEIMNTAPQGDLQREPEPVTPAIIRAREEHYEKQDNTRWVIFARENASGTIAGFTEVFLRADTPQFLYQGDTGVAAKYRGIGLAQWLKASMLAWLLRERPDVAVVHTNNAASNAAMLSINHRLGFKPTKSGYSWQVELAQVEAYLEAGR